MQLTYVFYLNCTRTATPTLPFLYLLDLRRRVGLFFRGKAATVCVQSKRRKVYQGRRRRYFAAPTRFSRLGGSRTCCVSHVGGQSVGGMLELVQVEVQGAEVVGGGSVQCLMSGPPFQDGGSGARVGEASHNCRSRRTCRMRVERQQGVNSDLAQQVVQAVLKVLANGGFKLSVVRSRKGGRSFAQRQAKALGMRWCRPSRGRSTLRRQSLRTSRPKTQFRALCEAHELTEGGAFALPEFQAPGKVMPPLPNHVVSSSTAVVEKREMVSLLVYVPQGFVDRDGWYSAKRRLLRASCMQHKEQAERSTLSAQRPRWVQSPHITELLLPPVNVLLHLLPQRAAPRPAWAAQSPKLDVAGRNGVIATPTPHRTLRPAKA